MTDENVRDGGGVSYTVLIGAAISAPLLFQVLLLVAVRGDNVGWSTVVLIPLLLTAGVGAYVLVFAYWHIRSESDLHDDAIRAALLLTLPVTLAVVQLFAGTALLLWDAGVLMPAAGSPEPNLWATENLYAWLAMDAIPLIDLPDTLGWVPPVTFTDPVSGWLSLAFKGFLLLPLVGLAAAVFASWSSGRIDEAAEHRARVGDPSLEGVEGLFIIARSVVKQGAIVVIAFAMLLLVVAPDSPLAGWLTPLVLEWLVMAVRIAGVVVLVLLLMRHLIRSATFGRAYGLFPGSIPMASVVVMQRVVTLGLLLAIVCGFSLLAPPGLVAAVPEPSQQQLLPALVGWYSSNLLGTVPFLEIPATLGWVPAFEFVDPWSRCTLLLLKLVLVAIMFLPVVLLTRMFVELSPSYMTRNLGVADREA